MHHFKILLYVLLWLFVETAPPQFATYANVIFNKRWIFYQENRSWEQSICIQVSITHTFIFLLAMNSFICELQMVKIHLHFQTFCLSQIIHF